MKAVGIWRPVMGLTVGWLASWTYLAGYLLYSVVRWNFNGSTFQALLTIVFTSLHFTLYALPYTIPVGAILGVLVDIAAKTGSRAFVRSFGLCTGFGVGVGVTAFIPWMLNGFRSVPERWPSLPTSLLGWPVWIFSSLWVAAYSNWRYRAYAQQRRAADVARPYRPR